MTYAIFGAGMMGCALAQDLLESTPDPILLADIDQSTLDKCSQKIQCDRLHCHQLDVLDIPRLHAIVDQADVLVSAVNHRWALSKPIMLAAIEKNKPMVDLDADGWEERLAHDAMAKQAGIQVLVGMGVAPGLSNILFGYAAAQLEQVHSGVIRCGGLPQDYPVPPLDYRIVFDFEGLFTLYLDHPKVIENGEVRRLPNLSGYELISYPEPIGSKECFNTDGLTTLVLTMKEKGIQNLYEKTIRNPGHLEKIELFIESGLWDLQAVDGVVPRQFFAKLIQPKLQMKPGDKDLTILDIEAQGMADGVAKKISLLLVDYFDERKGITSMARTTAYPASVGAQMLRHGQIKEKGVTPLETLFVGETLHLFLHELDQRGITFNKKIEIVE